MLSGFLDFHAYLLQSILGLDSPTGVRNRVQPEVIDFVEIAARLETKRPDLDRRATGVCQPGHSTSDVADDRGVRDHYNQNQHGWPVTTKQIHGSMTGYGAERVQVG